MNGFWLLQQLKLLGFFLLWALAAYMGGRSYLRFHPPAPGPRPELSWRHAALGFSLYLCFTFFIASLLLTAFRGWFPQGFARHPLLFAGYAQMGSLWLAAGALAAAFRRTPAVVLLFFGPHSPGIARAARLWGRGMTVWIWAFPTVVAGGQVLAIALFFLTGQERVEQSAVRYLKSTMSHPTLFFFTTVTIALLVPVIEEFLFRGLLQNALRRLCGGKGAVIVTAFVFGLFHFTPGQGSGNVEIIGSLVLLSLFLGFSYERTASLWTPIGLHSAYNAMTILFLALDQDVPL